MFKFYFIFIYLSTHFSSATSLWQYLNTLVHKIFLNKILECFKYSPQSFEEKKKKKKKKGKTTATFKGEAENKYYLPLSLVEPMYKQNLLGML